MNALRLALVVHGRFHVFDLARELIKQGHDVTLFTNYPKRICARFGVPRERVVNYLAHGVASRALGRLLSNRTKVVERWSNSAFGRWAARVVPSHGPWDAVACMSGVAEELFEVLGHGCSLRVLRRGSVHIREQKRILLNEECIGGGTVEQPSDWIISREEHEYELADVIQVLSAFALDSFLRAGSPHGKVELQPLGVNVAAFKPDGETIEARLRRLRSKRPLRILSTGLFCRRKGARCWQELLDQARLSAEYRFVGTIAPDAVEIARSIADRAQFRSKVPQASLPGEYAWADLFVLPTLEDGFAVVVAQALAAGLPVVTATSCGASSLVEDGVTGWIIPPGSAATLGDCLQRLDSDRARLVAGVRRLDQCEFSRDWADVARDFAQSIHDRRTASAGLTAC